MCSLDGAPTTSSIGLDTFRRSVPNCTYPFKNLTGSIVNRCAFLSLKMTRRLRNFLHQPAAARAIRRTDVSSGAEAEQLASDQAYDLVLLDLNLPGAGGLDVLRGIRSKRPDLPVVIVTAASMVEECVRGLDCRRGRYVAKTVRLRRTCRADSSRCFAEEAGPRARFSKLKTSKSTVSATPCAAEVTTSI